MLNSCEKRKDIELKPEPVHIETDTTSCFSNEFQIVE